MHQTESESAPPSAVRRGPVIYRPDLNGAQIHLGGGGNPAVWAYFMGAAGELCAV